MVRRRESFLRFVLVGLCSLIGITHALAQGVSFLARRDFVAGTAPVSVTAADFNGDAWLDLAVVNSVSNSVSVLLALGDGQFAAAQNIDVGGFPQAIVAGDFNNDERQDLVVVMANTSSVALLPGLGD